MKTLLLTLSICAALSACIAYVDPNVSGPRGAHRDRDGDGVRNRNDARPNDPRRY